MGVGVGGGGRIRGGPSDSSGPHGGELLPLPPRRALSRTVKKIYVTTPRLMSASATRPRGPRAGTLYEGTLCALAPHFITATLYFFPVYFFFFFTIIPSAARARSSLPSGAFRVNRFTRCHPAEQRAAQALSRPRRLLRVSAPGRRLRRPLGRSAADSTFSGQNRAVVQASTDRTEHKFLVIFEKQNSKKSNPSYTLLPFKHRWILSKSKGGN